MFVRTFVECSMNIHRTFAKIRFVDVRRMLDCPVFDILWMFSECSVTVVPIFGKCRPTPYRATERPA